MGYVYSALDTELGRLVALKFLAPEVVATRPAIDRLIREAKAASALNHPHIVTVYGVVRSGDDVAIAMELVEGKPLRSYCGDPQPIVQVIRWGRQVAQALAAAHHREIVHHDIKPENLMVRSDGYVKVLDFGLARQLTSGSQRQIANSSVRLAGTLNYMAPEQTRAEAATSASDVFSLGIVLFELATGTHPFRSDSPLDTAHAIAHADPKSPSALNHEIPAALNSLLLAMLAKRAEERPSAAEVDRTLSELERAPSPTTLTQVPSPASGASGSGGTTKWWVRVAGEQEPRRPARSAGLRYVLRYVAGLTACLLCALAVWLERGRIFPPHEPVMTQLTAQVSENRVTAAAISPDGKSLAYAELGGPIVLRRMSDGFTGPVLTPTGLSVDRIAWFADGSRLLVSGSVGDQPSGVWVIPIHDGSARRVVTEGRDAVPSPDGTRIAFTSLDGSEMWVVGVQGGAAREVRAGGSTTTFSSLIWSPDSRRIAYERQDYSPSTDRQSDDLSAQLEKNYAYSYESVDLQTGHVPASAKNVVITSACGLPDGRVLFLRWIGLGRWHEGRDKDLTLVHQMWELRTDPHTGKLRGPPRQLTHSTDLALSSISSSDDGKQAVAVVTTRTPNIYVADLPPPGTVPRLLNTRRLTFAEANEFPHAWTPDNNTIIFESNRYGNWNLYRQNISQGEAEPLVISPGDNVLAHITPDGKCVIYQRRIGPNDWTLMRVPTGGGNPQPVPIGGKLGRFDEYQCPSELGAPCVLRTAENGQFVFSELDPARGTGPELARTGWGPAVTGDWDLSPDGSQAAIPNHNPQDAKIRLVRLTNHVPGMAERTITLNGLRYLSGVVWAADGKGWFVAVRTSFGTQVFYANLQGQSSELLKNSAVTYIVPSPDGRHVAFPQDTARSNAWLLHGF
jgi:Tol biopolymer transport system component